MKKCTQITEKIQLNNINSAVNERKWMKWRKVKIAKEWIKGAVK